MSIMTDRHIETLKNEAEANRASIEEVIKHTNDKLEALENLKREAVRVESDLVEYILNLEGLSYLIDNVEEIVEVAEAQGIEI